MWYDDDSSVIRRELPLKEDKQSYFRSKKNNNTQNAVNGKTPLFTLTTNESDIKSCLSFVFFQSQIKIIQDQYDSSGRERKVVKVITNN